MSTVTLKYTYYKATLLDTHIHTHISHSDTHTHTYITLMYSSVTLEYISVRCVCVSERVTLEYMYIRVILDRNSSIHTTDTSETYTQRDIYTERHTHRETYTQRDIHTERHIHRETYTQRDIYTERHIHRETYT